MSEHIKSCLFFTHVRRSTSTISGVSRQNCHPFVYQNWTFMHNGSIGSYPQLKKALEMLVADVYYVARAGSTDSELIFMLALTYGLENSPVESIEKAINVVLSEMQRLEIDDKFLACIALTNGEKVWAFRWSHCMKGTPSPSLYYGLPTTAVTDSDEVLKSNGDSLTPATGERLRVEISKFLAMNIKEKIEVGAPEADAQEEEPQMATILESERFVEPVTPKFEAVDMTLKAAPSLMSLFDPLQEDGNLLSACNEAIDTVVDALMNSDVPGVSDAVSDMISDQDINEEQPYVTTIASEPSDDKGTHWIEVTDHSCMVLDNGSVTYIPFSVSNPFQPPEAPKREGGVKGGTQQPETPGCEGGARGKI
jgi:predicted glutamine amidotransferase